MKQRKNLDALLHGELNCRGFEGTDMGMMTGLEWQRLALYGITRKELAEKYPKPEAYRENDDDILDIAQARQDSKAGVFLRALDDVHTALEKVNVLQHLATDEEKIIVRFYAHLTRNWDTYGAEFLKTLEDSDLYEIVESYFKILRKYGLSTYEEPYYFLSPRQRRNIKLKGEMIRRSTQIDDSEIKVSLLEGFI